MGVFPFPMPFSGPPKFGTMFTPMFTPASLFSASEPGVWYDPSDIERYMATGSELVSNGDFSSGSTGWTLGTGWSVSSGVASVVAPGTTTDLTASITLVAGRAYQISCTISSYSAGSVTPRFTGVTNVIGSNFPLSNGTFTQVLVAVAGNNGLTFRANSTANFSVDNISVKELVNYSTATMFQDINETLPVNGLEQPVALIKDRSRVASGPLFGSELVSNGTFDTTVTGWTDTNGTSASVSGELELTGGGGFYPRSQQTVTVTNGKVYLVSITMRRGTTTSNVYYNVTGLSDVQSSSTTNQTYTFALRATSSSIIITLGIFSGTGSGTAYFDNISVKEVGTTHAFQTTVASCPVLSARANLTTKTEELNHTDWTQSRITVTREMITPPSGVSTAWRIADNSTTVNNARIYSTTNIATVTNRSYKLSFYLKAGTLDEIFLRRPGSTTDANGVFFNTTTGVATNVGTVTSSSMTAIGNGWYRCEAIMTAATTTSLFYLSLSLAGATVFQLTAGTQYVIIAGPDMRENTLGASLPEYQAVNTSTSYTTTGFPYYLRFDGVDDFLQTATITPNTDKVQVFAGARKLSDAASGIFIEASASVNSNAGTFNIFAPSGAAANYTAASRGSAAAVVASYTNAAIAAPVTNQLTLLSDIAGDNLVLRMNGSDVAQSTSDQGTGTFTAQPFYIGRRAGTSTPFNGNLYSLIARFGPNLDAATIGDAETWVNGKTKAY